MIRKHRWSAIVTSLALLVAASRWARLLHLGVVVALVGGILMSANHAVMSGDTLPGINAANPFNEGLSIDSLLTIIGLGLLIVHSLALRQPASVATAVEQWSDQAA
jgi:hypothetical protein